MSMGFEGSWSEVWEVKLLKNEMIWLWMIWGILTYAELSQAAQRPFDESVFLLNPSSHILSVAWKRPSSAHIDRSTGCGQITVYEKFIGSEKIVTPDAGDFYMCSYTADEGLDSLSLEIDITSFKVKQFRTYRVCVETFGGQACTRKFSIETAIPYRRKKKDPFVESIFYLDSYSHQLSLEWTRKNAGVQGKCIQLDVLEKFIGPIKLLSPFQGESYACEYITKDGMDHLTVSVDISSYKLQPFRSYIVCVKVEEDGGVEKACTRSFSLETIVPYGTKSTVDLKNSVTIEYNNNYTVIPYKRGKIMNISKVLEKKAAFSVGENLEKDISDGIGLQKDKGDFEEDTIIVEKSIQSYGVEQNKHNFDETGNTFQKLENQFKDEGSEVDKVDITGKVKKSEQQFDEPMDMPDDSVTTVSSDQCSAQASVANVYIVLIIIFLCN